MDPNYIPYKKVVGEAERGDSAYNHLEMAGNAGLDANAPIQGGVATRGTGFIPNTNSNVSVTGPTGEVETTASKENLSAKYKYPQVSQDTVPNGSL